VKYLSTRGDQTPRGFSDILLEGLAPDGGLYLPTHYPRSTRPRCALARPVLCRPGVRDPVALHRRHPGGRPARAGAQTYTEAGVRHDAITPLHRWKTGLYLEALSNGPTLAFKDMAMQLLGNLFEYELARRGERSTSSAPPRATPAARRVRDARQAGVRVFMLSPHGRMSPFQQAQMFSLQDANIHNIASRACSTTARTSSRRSATTSTFKRRAPHRHRQLDQLGAPAGAGGVLLRRLLPGHALVNDEQVSFAVPSGNFGNICAGHVARMMGLPIRRLVLATNENDVLDEFFRTGTYRVRGSAETHETSSPSMDISKASNFERFVFDLLGRDGAHEGAVRRRDRAKAVHPHAGRVRARREFGFVSGSSPRRPPGHHPRRAWQRCGGDDRHPHRRRPEGRARAPRARRADDRARNRACRPSSPPPSSRRWARARAPGRAGAASSNCPSASPDAGGRGGGEAVHRPARSRMKVIGSPLPPTAPRGCRMPTGLPVLDLNDADAVTQFLLADPARYEYRSPFDDAYGAPPPLTLDEALAAAEPIRPRRRC
jgi:threonine synthase